MLCVVCRSCNVVLIDSSSTHSYCARTVYAADNASHYCTRAMHIISASPISAADDATLTCSHAIKAVEQLVALDE